MLLVTIVALGFTVSACTSGQHISAQQKRAVTDILKAPTDSTTPPSRAATTTAPAPTAPPTTSDASSSTSTSVTIAPEPSSPSGPPPNVVGQNLTDGENQLQAAGYGTAAHPWAASCATLNLIMQQVPPQDDSVQLYYCAKAS
jgi:hypothetical protein